MLPVQADRPGQSWVSISASSAAVLLVGLATLWAVLAAGPDGQGAGGDGTGQGTALAGAGAADSGGGDALNDRLARRQAAGTGDGDQADTRAADKATPGSPEAKKKPEPSPPADSATKAGPTTRKTAPLDVIGEESLAAKPDEKEPVKEDASDSVWGAAPLSIDRAKRRDEMTKSGKGLAGKDGPSKESEAAVELGLAWLAKVQSDDGHWEPAASKAMRSARGGGNSVGITGLATLAFLGGGYDHQGKSKYQKTVAKAIEWLLANEGQDGRFQNIARFYEQGIAAMALCEACGMAGDKTLTAPATKAVTCVVDNIGSTGGYGYGGPGDDTHVTSYQVMAIKSATLADLQVPKKPITVLKLRTYYDVALNSDGTTNYSASGGHSTPARTAIGLFCRLLLDVSRKDPKVAQVARLVAETGPLVGPNPAGQPVDPRLRRITGNADVFQVYYGTYGMFQMGGQYWTNWNKQFRDPAVALQTKTGENAGSWDGMYGGRLSGGTVCTTAIYIMALEVYYRYLPFNR